MQRWQYEVLLTYFYLRLARIFSLSSQAFTSIATIEGHSEAWYRASNFAVPEQAESVALEGCQKRAKAQHLAKLAKKCTVVTLTSQPGYGALVCAKKGCAWVVSAQTAQDAVDIAYANCAAQYKGCQKNNIAYWEDFNGFERQSTVTQTVTTIPSLSDRYDAMRAAQFHSKFDGN